MSSPYTAKALLQELEQNCSFDSMEEVVIRHLLDVVDRFGEKGLQKALSYADSVLYDYLTTKDIARLNDALRCDLDPAANGTIVMTSGVSALGKEVIDAAMTALREFDVFTEDNDPYHEHDFGSFVAAGEKFMWKIDYYDLALEGHSPHPADPQMTRRVLTIMLPEEY